MALSRKDAKGLSRRSLLKLGAGMTVAGFSGRPANALPRIVSARQFDRGINAWPWFSFPAAFPPQGRPYPALPPFNPDRPVPRYEDLTSLAAAGFDFIRIPVCTAPFLYLSSAGLENQFWSSVGNVLDAVNIANSAGLGVVVNLQPDSTSDYTAADLYGPSASAIKFDGYTKLVGNFAKALETLQIDRLAFEPVNEPPHSVVPSASMSSSSARVAAANWATKQAALFTAARVHAPKLKLVATGAAGGSISGLVRLDPKPLIQSFDPILFTFHFYEPFLFSHQGAPWLAQGEPIYTWLNNVPWPGKAGTMAQTMASVENRMKTFPDGFTQSELRAHLGTIEAALRPYFDPPIDNRYFAGGEDGGNEFFKALEGWATTHDIGPDRILMGEFGALQTTKVASPVTGGPYVAANPADRARYLSDVRVEAERRGYGWAMWTLFNPGMGIMNETTRTLDAAVVDALGLKAS